MIRIFALLVLFSTAGWSQCQWKYNPFTKRLDCTIPAGAFSGTASDVPFTPSGNIAATDVDGAIQELDSEKQATNAKLTAFSGLTGAADKLPYFTGTSTLAVTDLSSFARTFLDDAAATNVRTTLGLVIGTDIEAHDADLTAFAGVSAAGLITRTGAGTAEARVITGTSNEISVADGDGVSANPTISLPAVIDLGGKTSLEIPNGASPTVNVFGQLAGDNNLWAASRGAPIFYDGTAATALVNVLVSDTPTNGQVPKWNTGGTITWENDTGSGAATAVTSSTTLPGTCTAGDVYFDTDATSGQRLYVCDSANTWMYVLSASGTGTGVLTLLEGTAPGAGANSGEHNLYFDSGDSKLKSHENGGSVKVYATEAGNIATATALAANGSNCSAGQFPLGVDASGASESCTALPTTIAGTSNEVAASASTGAVTLSLPSTLNLSSKVVRIPNSTTLPGTCTVGDMYMDTDATTGQRFYLCESSNTWALQGGSGGGGSIVETLRMPINGGGAAIVAGMAKTMNMDYACTLNGWTILSDDSAHTSGSIVVDVKKVAYASYPGSLSSIAASAKPTLSSANKNQDTTLTGWTTSISAGDILEFVVDSATTVTSVTVSLKCTR